jgi:hypothetical protein
MTFRENIEHQIKEKRPNLSASSLKTYVSILFNLHKKLNPEDEDIKWFDEDEKILEHLKEKPPSTRKTVLSALFVLTGKDGYNKVMLEDCKHTNDRYKEQKKSQKEEDGWVSVDEIKTIYDDLLEKVKLMFSQKLLSNYQVIVSFILLGCLGGVSGLAPRRSLDFCDMKIKDFDPKTDNYYKAGKFVFNKYKTAKDYGEQVVDVKEKAPEFNTILSKWVKSNPTDYLLFSSNQQKLTSPQVTRMLNKLFGKNTSTDLLRHIYLTNKYGKLQAEMAEDSRDMSHSLAQQALYIKK